MIRWLVVVAAGALGAAALAGVRGYRPNEAIFDEVLSYEVTPDRPLRIRIPGGVDEITMTTWAVVGRRPSFDAAAAYRYALGVTLETKGGPRKLAFDVATRIQRDPTRPSALGDFSARLADAEDWLGDARTERVDVSSLGRQGGFAVLAVSSERPIGRVLVRLAFLEPLGEFERDIRHRTLRPERGRRMVEGRSSLGFADLPQAVRERALSSFERRIPAVGRDGTDYLNRTILIGHRLPSAPEDRPEEEGIAIGPDRLAALNLRGPAKLRLHGDSGSEISIQEGRAPAYTVVVGESGRIDLDLAQPRARTVSIGAPRETRVHLSLPSEQAGVRIGAAEPKLEGQRAFVVPELRIQRNYRLNERDPLVLGFAPGQRRMGLVIRAILPPGAARARARVVVRGEGGPGFEAAPFSEELAASLFERAGDERVTVTRSAVVEVPAGVRSLSVTGSSETLVLPVVDEPGVAIDRVEPEYDVPLEEGDVWRHAPCVEKAVAAIRADNDAGLDQRGRVVRLVAQPRIEPLWSTGPALVERAAKPLGNPLGRTLWRGGGAADLGATDPWTLLTPGEPREVVVPRAQAGAEFGVVYRVSAASLGGRLALELDGRELQTETLAVASGRLKTEVTAGRHRLRVSGAEGWLFATALPVSGSPFRRQLVHELPRGGVIDLRFERHADELISLFVSAVSELSDPPPLSLSYEIDPGKRPPAVERLLRRVTVRSGQLPLARDERDRGLLWELDVIPDREMLPHPAFKVSIQLGDDLLPGEHVLRLGRTSDVIPGSLWVRAVVAGRRLDAGEAREEGE